VYLRVSDGKVRNYPPSFTYSDLENLAALLLSAKGVVPLRDVAGKGAGVVGMRHDVDHDLEHALKFARWEAEHGFRSSYFVLPDAWYARKPEYQDLLHELKEMGHEVGLHSNVIGMAYAEGALTPVDGSAMPAGFCTRAAQIMRDQLAGLRALGLQVVGTAAHGSGVAGLDNLALWAAGYDPADFGLEYEAYHLHREAFYLSDNRGRWTDPPMIASDRPTHVLIHPCHWDLP
jgi:hypothetical protein